MKFEVMAALIPELSELSHIVKDIKTNKRTDITFIFLYKIKNHLI